MFSELSNVTRQILDGQAVAQFAAICVRNRSAKEGDIEILLITSRDTGRWIIPKGWGMRHKKPHQVAKREAWEEAGVLGHVKKRPIGYYTYAKKLGRGEVVASLVQVHLLHVLALTKNYPEIGQRELRWFKPAEAAAAVNEPELKSLLRGMARCAK